MSTARTARPLALLLCLAFLTACQAAPEVWKPYGAEIAADTPLALEQLLADPASFDGQDVLLEATVDECCQAKGCWMTLTLGEQMVRVTFLDYGFFVPMDIAGRTVRVEGVFGIRMIPVEEAQHYLEDAGKHDEAAAITEPQQGFQLVAHGVLLQSVGS